VTEKGAHDSASVAGEDAFEDRLALPSPITNSKRRKRHSAGSESDTDFQAETEVESEGEPEAASALEVEKELGTQRRRETTTITTATPSKQNGEGVSMSRLPSKPSPKVVPPKLAAHLPTFGFKATLQVTKHGKASSRPAPTDTIDLTSPSPIVSTNRPKIKPFKRAQIPIRTALESTYGSHGNKVCPACRKQHLQGACELKISGVEHCGLCGLAHYGHSRTCPHIKSETQVRAMLEALKNSPEQRELVDAAMKYLRGVKGTLVQQKKRDRDKAATLANGGVPPAPVPTASRPVKTNTAAGPRYSSHALSGLSNGAASQFPDGPPQREVPSWYKGPVGPEQTPATILTQAEQQRMSQMQAQGHNEEEMESALRGFLGQE
jgi:chromodomain-helicase-DNA-binding protein 4